MLLLAFILTLALILRLLKLPVFEGVFGILLFTPIVAYLAGLYIPLSAVVYFLIVGFSAAALFFWARRSSTPTSHPHSFIDDLIVMAIFTAAFLSFYSLCLLWPDFIAIGERLRDYALLAAVIDSPIRPEEPWLAGYDLNYYIYWYRFGHMLSSMFFLEIWEVYHQLQSLTFALFFSSIYWICSKHMRFSKAGSVVAALIISLGSNVAGVIVSLGRTVSRFREAAPETFTSWADYIIQKGLEASGGGGWWGPSRVINGAINEFPAWSFLLGDVHPHYLNLPLIPFFILLGLLVVSASWSTFEKLVLFIAFALVPPLWLYSANAWEVPIWAGFFAVSVVLLSVSFFSQKVPSSQTDVTTSGWASIWILFITIIAGFSLYLSSLNLSAPETPLRFVTQAIGRSSLSDIFLHWGFPLAVILLSILVLIKDYISKILLIIFASLSLMYTEALPFLTIIFLFNFVRLAELFYQRAFASRGREHLIFEGIGISALALLILPELVFLDDAYGGELERMNTIFKIYSSNWFLLHIFAFYLTKEAFCNRLKMARTISIIVILIIAFLSTGFFVQTIELRKNDAPLVDEPQRGLSSIETHFPGSAATILALQEEPRGVVLEAQGPAFSYTSHIATLSGHSSYLGWANHVNLLLREYDEVRRREENTDQFYESADCAERLSILKKEEIDYAVVGPLEKQQYPGVEERDFACLNLLVEFSTYEVYTP